LYVTADFIFIRNFALAFSIYNEITPF
jgi:hypothetical protein